MWNCKEWFVTGMLHYCYILKVMDRSTGRLYVGAVNHLYDLSPEGLAIREHALTGPRADSILCAGE